MQGLKFRIQHADGRVVEMSVEGDRALVGSGGHCDIRLPLDQAAVENIMIEAAPVGLVAEARSFQPAPTINESPFTRTQVAPDSVLGVGQTRIWVAAAELGEGANVVKKKQEKSSPIIYIMAAVFFPVALYMLFTDNGGGNQQVKPVQATALWSKSAPHCPQSSPEQALSLARDRAVLADAKNERRPFHVQDGVKAVSLYEEASACFRVANKPQVADAYGKLASKLKQEISNDYRTHRVRLEHALSIQDWPTVQEEVRVLLAFTDGQQNAYVTWLSNLDRKLRLKLGNKQ
jgi:hypothetical protein